MSAKPVAATDIRALAYADNDDVKVADRLGAEIDAGATDLSVVSGYFSPAVWDLLADDLSKLQRFRLLLGKDFELDRLDAKREERNIERLVQDAIRSDAEPDGLITQAKAEQIQGLIAFLEAQAAAHPTDDVVKLWRGEEFFHAKAYIAKHGQYGAFGIGSANFTFNGLSRNRELVGWRGDPDALAQVTEWYERHWDHPDAEPYTQQLIEALRATPLVSEQYTPYDVFIRTLAARYGVEPPPEIEGIDLKLHWFQEDAVQRLVMLLNGPARGALLADAVGLGKTFMAARVIAHYIYAHEERRHGKGRPVLLVVPASLRDYWESVLEDQGLEWACRLITMQSLRRGYDASAHEGADLVVIDEAHRLRGEGVWFHAASELLHAGGEPAKKRVLLLTATPVNTSMRDLVNLLRLLTKNNRSVWAPDIANFQDYLVRVEKGQAEPFPVLDRSLVRRSRSDILRMAAEQRASGIHVEELPLPKRKPQHVDYEYSTAGESLFDDFAHALRRLVLAPYDLERFRRTDAGQPALIDLDFVTDDDEDTAFRPGTLAALCAAGLLNRFQSSLPAIERSLRRVDAVQARFQEALEHDPPRLLALKDTQVRKLLDEESLALDDDDEEGGDTEEGSPDARDTAWQQAIEQAEPLEDAESFDLGRIAQAVAQDRQTIHQLLNALPDQQHDGKIAALLDALQRPAREASKGKPGLRDAKGVLIFTQFRDTARYVHERLREHENALGPVLITDGSVSSEQRRVRSAWFDPARVEGVRVAAQTKHEAVPRILVSTDVLAEGHNLQIADTVINFDLHFNPQVIVQRCGRIDRLGSKHKQIGLVSMLPPEDLDTHIGLLRRLDERFRRIHGLGLGDEQVTTLAGDRPGQTLEQLRALYRDDNDNALDEIELAWTFGSTDYMRSPLTAFLQAAGAERLQSIPLGASSVKRLPRDWPYDEGVFICMAAPPSATGDRQTHWRFYPYAPAGGYRDVVVDDVAVFRAISCRPTEPRAHLDAADRPPGPGVFDWQLIGRAAEQLAEEINRARDQAELHRGASEKSNKLRRELVTQTQDVADELTDLDDLLDRLEQVRVEDYDARVKGSQFERLRRDLKKAADAPQRLELARRLIELGLDLFGRPVDEDALASAKPVGPDDLQLVSYEVLLRGDATPAPSALEPAQMTMLAEDQPVLSAADAPGLP